MAKQITINELARMVANGFTEMYERFEQLESKIDDTNRRIDAFIQVIDDHSHRIKKLEQKTL